MAFRIFCDAVLDDRPLEVFGDGNQTRDFTFVGDVVAASRLAGERDGVSGGVFNVGGGSRVSVNDALRLLEQFAGRPLDVVRSRGQHGDVRDTGADISAAHAALGYAPAVPFEGGLREEWEWAVANAERRLARG
jgi:nucleoside-diphosphate-sugar epimerase